MSKICTTTIVKIKRCNEKHLENNRWLWCLTPRSTIFLLYRGSEFCFSDGRNRSNLRKPPTCHKSLTNLSHNVVSSRPHLSGVRTHNINSDRRYCIGSCKLIDLPYEHDHDGP